MENLSELESNILKAVEERMDVMKDAGFTNEEIETQLDMILDQIGERSDFFKEEIQTLKEEKLDIPLKNNPIKEMER